MNTTQTNNNKLCPYCSKFYGTQSNQGLCSVCFLSIPKSEQKSAITLNQNNKETQKQKQTDKNRCFKCNKKVGLLGVNCKCQYIFCNQHRLPQSHACKINYIEIGKQMLSKNIQNTQTNKIIKF